MVGKFRKQSSDCQTSHEAGPKSNQEAISYAYRMAEFGRDPWTPPSPTPLFKARSIRVRAVSSQVLSISKMETP